MVSLRRLLLLVLLHASVASAQPLDDAQAPSHQSAPSSPDAQSPDSAGLPELPPQAQPRAQPPPSVPLESPSEPPAYAAAATPRESTPFGEKTQWVIISTSSGAGISNQTFSGSAASFFNANIDIGIDSFVARNFSLGIDLEASHGDNKGYGSSSSLTETTSTYLAGGIRFGLNVPLGRLWSWYPRVTLGVESNQTDTQTVSVFFPGATAAPPQSASRIGPWINAFAPLLAHPVPHFFIGVGPRFEHNFGSTRGGPYDGTTAFLVNADLVVGGWWGGPSDSAAEDRDANSPRRLKRFGDQGQFVLTNATSASLASVTYANSSASSLRATLAPGFDYFVVDHLSLGADISFAYTKASGFEGAGTPTDYSDTSFGIGPRIGFDLPLLADWLSLWPRAEVGFGSEDYKLTSPFGSNEHNQGFSWVQASAPLLVHPAAHFFVGAGPYVSHDVARMDQNHVENDGTTVGASFLLGGWL